MKTKTTNSSTSLVINPIAKDEAIAKLKNEVERLTLPTFLDDVYHHLVSEIEHNQELANHVGHDKRSFARCVNYISRQSVKWLLDAQMTNPIYDIGNGYAGDIPDEMAYEWSLMYYLSQEEDPAASISIPANVKSSIQISKQESVPASSKNTANPTPVQQTKIRTKKHKELSNISLF